MAVHCHLLLLEPDCFGPGSLPEMVDEPYILNDIETFQISSPGESSLKFDTKVNVDIPVSGSAIVRTSNPPVDGRLTYLWIIGADPDTATLRQLRLTNES